MERLGADLDPWIDAEQQRFEAEVVAAEAALLDAEVVVETLRVELAQFAYVHHHRLGDLYARLDELDAEVAEAVALRTGDPEDLRRAREARARLDEGVALREAADAAEEADSTESGAESDAGSGSGPAPGRRSRRRVRPTKEAQRIYRELARRAHPDLAQDPGEKARREEFIRRVNDAYADSDTELLERLGREWAAGPDAAPARGSADRTGWLRTRLTWLNARLAELRAEQAELEGSAIGQLLMINPGDPDGLLDSLGAELAEQVVKYEELLRRIDEV